LWPGYFIINIKLRPRGLSGIISNISPQGFFYKRCRRGKLRHDSWDRCGLYFEGLLLIGLIPLFRTKYRNVVVLLILWLLISPLPAALATGVGYSGNRAEGMLPALQILVALGFLGWAGILKKFNKMVKFVVVAVFVLFSSFQIYSFAKNYFKIPSDIGVKECSMAIWKWLSGWPKIKVVRILTSVEVLANPRFFIAFAAKWDPANYQKYTRIWNYEAEGVSWLDQMDGYRLGNYTFGSFQPDALSIGRPGEFLKSMVPEKIIFYPDGSPAIYAKIN